MTNTNINTQDDITKVKVVELRNITKTFGSVVANKNVNLDLYKGEILSILGENGSGKTTAMNIISGIYSQEEGDVYINGEKVIIKSPQDSLKHGIGMVHQHFKLVDVFTAAENILLGLDKKEFRVNKAGLVEIVVLGSKEIVSINIEEDGFEPDNKEMIEDLVKDGLNELFSQIDEESAAIDEKIAGKSGMGF